MSSVKRFSGWFVVRRHFRCEILVWVNYFSDYFWEVWDWFWNRA